MNAIKKNLQRVIESGGYRLSDMLEKIDLLWGSGELNTADREELQALAKINLQPEQERPDLMEALIRLEEKYATLESRIAAMEKAEGSAAQPEQGYPLWHPWTGIPGSGYLKGQKVTHNGKIYENIYAGGENVWEPGALGTEGLWRQIE